MNFKQTVIMVFNDSCSWLYLLDQNHFSVYFNTYLMINIYLSLKFTNYEQTYFLVFITTWSEGGYKSIKYDFITYNKAKNKNIPVFMPTFWKNIRQIGRQNLKKKVFLVSYTGQGSDFNSSCPKMEIKQVQALTNRVTTISRISV